MRDLGQYLPELKRTRNSKRRSGYNIEFEVLTIEAINRAIKAEAENARLRKVAEAVADLYSDWMEYGYMDSITSRSLITVFETWKAVAELEADHD